MQRLSFFLVCILGASLAHADDLKFYNQVASVDLLQSKVVQAELKVTEEQRAKFNTHALDYNTQTKALQDKAQKGEITKEDFQKKVGEAQISLKSKILTELSVAQVTRLGQITLQQAGYIAILLESMNARLGITAPQTKTIKDAWEKLGKDVAEAERAVRQPVIEKYQKMDPKSDDEKKKVREDFEKEMAASNEKVQPALLKLKKDFETLVDSTLTAAQKKTWNDLKGPAFKPTKSN